MRQGRPPRVPEAKRSPPAWTVKSRRPRRRSSSTARSTPQPLARPPSPTAIPARRSEAWQGVPGGAASGSTTRSDQETSAQALATSPSPGTRGASPSPKRQTPRSAAQVGSKSPPVRSAPALPARSTSQRSPGSGTGRPLPAAALSAESGEPGRHSFITSSTRSKTAKAASTAGAATSGSTPATVMVTSVDMEGRVSERISTSTAGAGAGGRAGRGAGAGAGALAQAARRMATGSVAARRPARGTAPFLGRPGPARSTIPGTEMDDLSHLEQAVLHAVLDGEHPVLDALRDQLPGLAVTGREVTATSFTTGLRPDPGAPRAPVATRQVVLD